jgi:hypothetical protein
MTTNNDSIKSKKTNKASYIFFSLFLIILFVYIVKIKLYKQDYYEIVKAAQESVEIIDKLNNESPSFLTNQTIYMCECLDSIVNILNYSKTDTSVINNCISEIQEFKSDIKTKTMEIQKITMPIKIDSATYLTKYKVESHSKAIQDLIRENNSLINDLEKLKLINDSLLSEIKEYNILLDQKLLDQQKRADEYKDLLNSYITNQQNSFGALAFIFFSNGDIDSTNKIYLNSSPLSSSVYNKLLEDKNSKVVFSVWGIQKFFKKNIIILLLKDIETGDVLFKNEFTAENTLPIPIKLLINRKIQASISFYEGNPPLVLDINLKKPN